MSPAPNLKTGVVPYDRRHHQRFPIRSAAQYIVSGVRGQAATVDMSSGGVLLKTEVILPVGKQIQLFIDWPALLDERCPLRLIVFGKVLRSSPSGTAIGILRYDYRIRPRNTTPFSV